MTKTVEVKAQENGKVIGPAELSTIIRESDLEPTRAEEIAMNFATIFDQARKWELEARRINVTDASQTDQIKLARELRLQIKGVRVDATKTKKRLKENVLLEGRFIDGIYNAVLVAVKPIEDHLTEQEKFVEREVARIEKELSDARRLELAPYVDEGQLEFYGLGKMSDEAFATLLNNSRVATEQRVKAEKEADELRVKKEREEADERARIKAENERLREEAAERAVEDAKKAAAEEAARKEREDKDRAEKEKRDAELAAERKEKEELERKVQEQEARDASQKAEQEAEEKRRRNAPDNDKLVALRDTLLAIEMPDMEHDDGKFVVARVAASITRIEAGINAHLQQQKREAA